MPAGGRTVDGYIDALGEPRAETARRLREAIRAAAPDARESIKWGQPVYESDGPFVALKGFPRWVTLTFWRGAQLAGDGHGAGLLDGEGDRMRHVRFSRVDDVDAGRIGDVIRAAVELNRIHGDPTKRR
jgi:hypothetical protein